MWPSALAKRTLCCAWAAFVLSLGGETVRAHEDVAAVGNFDGVLVDFDEPADVDSFASLAPVASEKTWPWPPRALSTPGGQYGGSATPPKNPCAGAYKRLFFDNDFSYLDDPDYAGRCFGDCWKHMPAGPDGRWGRHDVGGQVRLRYHHEIGMDQDKQDPSITRFEPTEHDFMLSRLRLYENWVVDYHTRIYVEGICADTTDDNGTYLPRLIDRNYDFLNGFIDYSPDHITTFRFGRQELVYGAERLVSVTDWANVRRTFEGFKILYREGDWGIDGFYTHYVPVIPNELDRADYKQPFYGVYAVYEGLENDTLDLYYLGYDNNHHGNPVQTDFSINTVGARLFGNRGDWLHEFEAGYQFGRQSGLGQDQDAGFATGGLGYTFSEQEWKPTLWFYYDYASGNAGGDSFNGFNQLFPWGHRYFGFIDAVTRSNIEAPNVLLTLKPDANWDLLFWYWRFMAAEAGQNVESFGGTPPQSDSRTHFGDELDIIAKRNLGPRSNILFGYSHFWRGDKILAPKDADFTYIQWELNF